mgnify:CR=1 FL=1
MHLFLVHQFPDFDNFVPVVIDLKKKTNLNFSIMNVFPVHDLKYYRLNQLLDSHDIELIDISEVNVKSKFINFFLKFTKIIPKMILERLNRLWYFLYHKFNFFEQDNLIYFIKKKKIKSINIDKSLPGTYKQIISSACKKTNIKINCYNLGIEMRRNIKINPNDFDLYDNAIVQDQNLIIEKSDTKSKKIIRVASSRYSLRWIKEVENVYKYKLKDYSQKLENRNLKILLVTRPFFTQKSWEKIYKKLKEIKNIDLRIKLKPRGQFKPLHIQDNIINEYNTSELINWADVVVSHSSSILVEAVIKFKRVLFLNFLFDLEKKKKINYIFEDTEVVEYMNSFEQLINRLKILRSNNDFEFLEKYQRSRTDFLQSNIDKDYFTESKDLNKELLQIYLN